MPRAADVRAQVAATRSVWKRHRSGAGKIRQAAIAAPCAEAIGRPVAGRRKVEFVVTVVRIGTQESLEARMLPETVAAACKACGRQDQAVDVALDAEPDLKHAGAGLEPDADTDAANGLAGALGVRPEFGGERAHRVPL